MKIKMNLSISINDKCYCPCCLWLEALLSSDDTHRPLGKDEFAGAARCLSSPSLYSARGLPVRSRYR